MNKFCTDCGAEVSSGTNFCPGCGKGIEKAAEVVEPLESVESVVPREEPPSHTSDKQRTSGQSADLKSQVLGNLVMVGAVIMLIGLFVGSFYTTNAGGGYVGVYEIKGFNIPFSGIWYGVILLISPVVLLISNKVNVLKKNEVLLNLGFGIASFILVFVLKSQIAAEWGNYGSSASLAMGAYIYLVGNTIAIALSGMKAAGYKTDAKSLEAAVKNKNVDSLK